MSSLNKVILIGRLGKDPEVRYMPNGNAVCNFSLATSESWKDKEGEKQEKTEWHNIVIYGKLAEIAGEYLKKGSQAYFEGKINTEKWQDKEGNERFTTKITANEMKMLDSAPSGSSAHKPTQTKQETSKAAQSYAKQSGGSRPSDFDDDIPF